jgi:hypothetical protein
MRQCTKQIVALEIPKISYKTVVFFHIMYFCLMQFCCKYKYFF